MACLYNCLSPLPTYGGTYDVSMSVQPDVYQSLGFILQTVAILGVGTQLTKLTCFSDQQLSKLIVLGLKDYILWFSFEHKLLQTFL